MNFRRLSNTFCAMAFGLVLLPVTGVSQDKMSMALDEALIRALQHADTGEELKLTRERLHSAAGLPDAAYDPVLYGSLIQDIDRSEQVLPFYGDKTLRTNFEAGIRKLFSTGTFLDAKLQHARSESFFPEQPEPQPTVIPVELPAGLGTTTITLPASASAGSSSGFLSLNPSYETKLEVTVSQSLTRNLMSRQLKLQKDLILASEPDTQYATALQLQGLSAAVEAMYIEVQALDARVQVMKDGIGLVDEMIGVARRKVKLGRAEDKDVLTVQSVRLAQEKALVNLQSIRRSLVVQLKEKIGLGWDQAFTPVPLVDEKVDEPETLDKLLAKSLQDRFDLKLQKQGLHRAEIKLEQAKVGALPDVNAFVGMRANGLEGAFGDSLTDVVNDGDNLSFTFGVKGEWTFGKRPAVKNARLEVENERRLVALKKKRVLRDVERDLVKTLTDWENARSMIDVMRRREVILKKLITEEERLYRSARSDAALVLQHKQELVTSRLDLIDNLVAYLKARNAVRIATHSYDLTPAGLTSVEE